MLITILAGILSVTQPGDSLLRFPVVAGKNLQGKAFSLPRDFEGELNIAVIAFRREQQAAVDAWMPGLKKLAAEQSALSVYELPTLARSYSLMRSFIDGGMRRGIPDANVRASTITLYIGKDRFKRALQIVSEAEIQLFLVDRSGNIYWRTSGTYSETSIAALAKPLRDYREGNAVPLEHQN